MVWKWSRGDYVCARWDGTLVRTILVGELYRRWWVGLWGKAIYYYLFFMARGVRLNCCIHLLFYYTFVAGSVNVMTPLLHVLFFW